MGLEPGAWDGDAVRVCVRCVDCLDCLEFAGMGWVGRRIEELTGLCGGVVFVWA